MTAKIKQLIKKYSHIILLIYFAFYMPWFTFLNHFTPTRNPTPIYSVLDDFIPFCEWFSIPYFVWFGYVAAGFAFLIFTSRRDFIRMCIFLYTGMTVCLIIYTLFPNCQELRVDYSTLGRDNILIDWIAGLQAYDTPCNVFPSIHCLNSIGIHISLVKSKFDFKGKKIVIWVSFILTVLIILSTVFLKQHSILDVFGSFILSVPLYFLAYKPKLKFIKEM